MRFRNPILAATIALAAAQPVESQNLPPAPAAPTLTYADLADLALAAPVVAHVRVESADRLNEREAPNVATGQRRFLVEASVIALIRGTGGLQQRISYLVDLGADADGRPARLRRRTEFLVLASRVPNNAAWLQLVAPDAQLPFTQQVADRLRTILRDATTANAPPRLTGVGRAFHVPGSLPGESESQIFLLTADSRPISLNILRRPGETPRWSVALGEMVDEAAAPPMRDTLLWYRLACSLPQALPRQSLAEAQGDEAQAIRADYQLVLEGLGRCDRTRRQR